MFEKLNETLAAIGDKASNIAEKNSLNLKIDAQKKIIAEAYGEIGEKFYVDNKDSVPAGYEEMFAKAATAYAVIEEHAARLKVLAGIRTCPSCGADVDKNFRFCVNCGEKMPEEEVEDDGKLVCDKCGAQAEEGAVFCTNCGNKITPKKEKKPENVCTRCGAKLVDGAVFCTTCGLKIELPKEEEAEAKAEKETEEE